MEYWRAVLVEEALDRVQSGGAQFFKEPKAEGLRAGRVHAIEDGVRSAAFDPCGSAFGGMAATSFSLLDACETFGAFQAS